MKKAFWTIVVALAAATSAYAGGTSERATSGGSGSTVPAQFAIVRFPREFFPNSEPVHNLVPGVVRGDDGTPYAALARIKPDKTMEVIYKADIPSQMGSLSAMGKATIMLAGKGRHPDKAAWFDLATKVITPETIKGKLPYFLNSSGQEVGRHEIPIDNGYDGFSERIYRTENGVVKYLEGPDFHGDEDFANGEPISFSEQGDVLAVAADPEGNLPDRYVIWQAIGSYAILPDTILPRSISPDGTKIVGSSNGKAMFWTTADLASHDISTGAGQSAALDINSSDEIVCMSAISNGPPFAYIYSGEVSNDLTQVTTGLNNKEMVALPLGINDDHQIVALTFTPGNSGGIDIVVLTPDH